MTARLSFFSFGSGVALTANTALIGARGATGSGAGYVFVRTGTAWTQQAKLVGNDSLLDDLRGSSAALSGETAGLGAPGHDAGGDRAGAAYVIRTGSVWAQQAKLSASDATALREFGTSAAAEGDRIVVGAPFSREVRSRRARRRGLRLRAERGHSARSR